MTIPKYTDSRKPVNGVLNQFTLLPARLFNALKELIKNDLFRSFSSATNTNCFARGVTLTNEEKCLDLEIKNIFKLPLELLANQTLVLFL